MTYVSQSWVTGDQVTAVELTDMSGAITSASSGIADMSIDQSTSHLQVTLADGDLVDAGAVPAASDSTVAPILQDTASASYAAVESTIDAHLGGDATGLVPRIPVTIRPEQYGAVGDGIADDTNPVVQAFSDATAMARMGIGGNIYSAGATVVLEGTYSLSTLSAPIVATCNIDGARGVLIAPNDWAESVLIVGHAKSGSTLHNADIRCPDVTKSSATSLVGTAVQIQNITHSKIRTGRTTFFGIGLWFTGLGQGCVYNEVFPGWTDLCKVAWKFAPQAGGWVNQLTISSGGVTQSPNTLDGTGNARRAGYRHVVIDGSSGVGTVNALTFNNVSLEGNLSEFHIDATYATNIIFEGSTRFEQGVPSTPVTVSGAAITSPAHGLAVNDQVIFVASGALPGLMFSYVPYYVAAVTGTDTFTVSATRSGTPVTFTSAGSGVSYYCPPRVLFDGTGGNTTGNDIKSGYYAYPGPLDVRRTNGATYNHVAAPASTPANVRGRNILTNGQFSVNQRSYASNAALAVGAYGFDRWKSSTASTRITFTPAPQGQIVSVTGSIVQVVPRADANPGTYTLSWIGSAQARVYNVGATAPAYSVSPLTVDIDGTSDVAVEFNAGTVFQAKLERGSEPTAFSGRSFGDELARCQRYFIRYGAPGAATTREPLGNGVVYSSSSVRLPLLFPATMASAPTMTVTSISGLRLLIAGTVINPTGITATTTTKAASLNLALTGQTPGQAGLVDTGDIGTTVDFSAEL